MEPWAIWYEDNAECQYVDIPAEDASPASDPEEATKGTFCQTPCLQSARLS
jgi:hypothetical protein